MIWLKGNLIFQNESIGRQLKPFYFVFPDMTELNEILGYIGHWNMELLSKQV